MGQAVRFVGRIKAKYRTLYNNSTWSRDLNTEFKLGNCFFRAVKLKVVLDLMDLVFDWITVLDLMHIYNFHDQMVNWVKVLLYLE